MLGALSEALASSEESFVIDGLGYLSLTNDERHGFEKRAADRSLIIFFAGPPKQMRLRPPVDMYVVDDDALVFVGVSDEYTEKRTRITRMVRSERRRIEAAYLQDDDDPTM